MSADTAEFIEHATPCVAASTAACVLIVLSWFNAVHSPLFDCIRAGAQAWRSRRNAVVPEICVERAVLASRIPLLNSRF
jgi:hypothetical protein